MSILTQFFDVKINTHKDKDSKQSINESIITSRRANLVVFDNPLLLKSIGANPSEGLFNYEYLQLIKFNPKYPESKKAVLKLIDFAIDLAGLLKDLHQRNLSIGLISTDRFYLDENERLKIIGNTLFTESYNSLGYDNYALNDFLFMPPECYENNDFNPDYRADFYALGVLMYRWFTGTFPYKGKDKLELRHKHLTTIPTSPITINEKIPKSLSSLMLNLLEKNPVKRYSSAYGIYKDLEKIKHSYLKDEDLDFGLNLLYNPGQINFNNTLYGRDEVLQKIKESYAKIDLKNSQTILIEGFSGVGKTSVVNKFLDEVDSSQTLFLNGKFDQYKQTPYSAIHLAFKDFEKQILLKSKIKRDKLKHALSHNLGRNITVLEEIIPSIANFSEKVHSLEELNPIESRNRFNFMFYKLCKALNDLGLKLIFFIDDWQWCDQPSLQLVHSLLKQNTSGILFLFAYRGNEIGENHAFNLLKREIQESTNFEHIFIDSLSLEITNRLISDTLNSKSSSTKELSRIIHQKTKGNPFYIKQFVSSLNEKQMLTFDGQTNSWLWNNEKIENEKLSDNVIDLITKSLDQLSFETQIIFKIASFVGGRFDFNLISKISNLNSILIGVLLDVALESGYIKRRVVDNAPEYLFTHDRIQQASYQLTIPNFQIDNENLHYKIGNILLSSLAEENYLERDVLGHFLASRDLISKSEATQIIEMILDLKTNPNVSITPDATIEYLDLGLHLNNKYQTNISNFKLLLGLSESSFLINDLVNAESWADKALLATKDNLEKARVYQMKMLFYESFAMYEKNIETGLAALKLFDINAEIHFHNKSLEPLIQDEYNQFSVLVKENYIKDLSQRKMENPVDLAVMDVLVNMNASAYFADLHLFAWSTLKMSNQTLKFGLTNSTPFAFVFMGSLLVALYKNFDWGYTFGKSGVDLLQYVDSDQYKCRTLSIFPIFIQHFKEPIRNSITNLEDSIYSGLETGDLPYAGYSYYAKVRDAFLSGDSVEETLKLCEESIEFMKGVNNLGLLALMKLLRGSLLKLSGTYTKDYIAIEQESLNFLIEVKFFTAVSHHYIFRSWVCCILGEFNVAQKLLHQNEDIIIYAASQPHVPKHYFLDSLCILSVNKTLTKDHKERIKANQEILHTWSRSMPENFAAEYYLINTLLTGYEGKIDKALSGFNETLHWTDKGKLIGVKALALESISNMLNSSNYEILGKIFSESSEVAYENWGAHGKLNRPTRIQEIDSDSSFQNVDLNTSSLIKAMQAISSEVDKTKAIKSLLIILMENAGADRSALLLMENGEPFIEAELILGQEDNLLDKTPLNKHKSLPKGIIEFVINTSKEFVLDDKNTLDKLNETYINKKRVKSLLALPLIRQKELIGVLYLENSQFEGLFKGDQLEILRLLASQAAISIYNTLLFKETTDLNIDLQESKEELSKMNLLLEDKIKDRTKVLRQEIETRKQIEDELKKAQKEAEKFHQQQIKLERRDALQSKMMMLSSQMNPHFIFNSLGSVQSYILNNETNKAVDFISDFAGLMRKNLINSTTEYISIAEEIEFLDKYLLLEKIRFNNSFNYKIVEDINNVHDTLIPPMLLQPFIENSIIHGLSRLKSRIGELTIDLKESEDLITCTIIDNGIGRENAMKHKSTGHKSVAISNLETRLELLNSASEENEYTYEIIDLFTKGKAAGTKVIVKFPNDLH